MMRVLQSPVLALTFLLVSLQSASAASKSDRLVTLRRVSDRPTSVFVSGLRFGRTIPFYDDSGDPWYITVSYSKCPVTPRGALRLTLYKSPPAKGGRRPSGHRTLYSHTVVDRRESDRATYKFRATFETYFFAKIEIPSKKGCKEWSFASQTN